MRQPEWINTVQYIPLLRYSVLATLLSEYVPDGVGISPSTLHITKMHSQQSNQEDAKVIQNGERVRSVCESYKHIVWLRLPKVKVL